MSRSPAGRQTLRATLARGGAARIATLSAAIFPAAMLALLLSPSASHGQAAPAAPLTTPMARPTCDRAQPLPPKVRLEFAAQASLGPLSLDGDTELSFQRADDRYTLRSETRAPMVGAEQRSSGKMVIDGAAGVRRVLLAPAEFVERSGRRDPRTVRIDGPGGRVTFSANAGQPAVAPAGLQDRLSLLVQAGQQLRVAIEGAAATTMPVPAIELAVAGARRISTYQLQVRGAETLDLPAGRIDTWKLERPRDAEHDGLEAWVAPSLCWLPVRLRFTDERGTVIENRLRAARFD